LTRIVEKTIRNLCNVHGCRVNNLEEAAEERGLRPFRPDVIVERAREFLREDRLRFYSLLTQNCEHFATKCRYGQPFSLQVSDCISTLFEFILTLCLDFYHFFYPRVFDPWVIMNEVRENENRINNIELF
jgi:hypothetical protein